MPLYGAKFLGQGSFLHVCHYSVADRFIFFSVSLVFFSVLSATGSFAKDWPPPSGARVPSVRVGALLSFRGAPFFSK